MRNALLLPLVILLAVTSCASYTVERGLEGISTPTYAYLPPTKLATIQDEADRIAQEEAKRQAEAEAIRQAEEAVQRAIESRQALNAYPNDLAEMTFPHIYRPVNSLEVLDPSFTRIDVMLLPLGHGPIADDDMTRIVNSVKDTGMEFIFVTGSLDSQVAFSKALGMDAVTLEGGTICFTSDIVDAESSLATFSLCDGKDIDLMVMDIGDDMALASDLDIVAWQEHLSQECDESIAALDSLVALSDDDQKILALSSSEPSSLDWSIFTPYDYRTSYAWPISDHLRQTFSDTYRATHFSEETDTGITLSTSSIHERMDFLYTQGIIEVSSSSMTIAGLSDKDISRYATIATYIIP